MRAGKGLISLHGVTYGPFFNTGPKIRLTGEPPWAGFPALIGAAWKAVGHAPRHVFEVEWVDREHPVARGLPARFTANDELYHRIEVTAEARVLARAFDDPANKGTGQMEPIVWVVSYGQGRTLHISLGHDLAAMHQPGFLAVLTRGAEWVARGEVAPASPGSAPLRALLVTGTHPYPTGLYAALEGYDDLVWEHAALAPGMKGRYDVAVIGEIPGKISEAEKKALREFVETGGGVVALHHAAADEAKWAWWHEEAIGARYKAGSKPQPAEMLVRAAAPGHPMLKKVAPLIVKDEAYQEMWFSPGVKVLMRSSGGPAVVTGPHRTARVVYIQPGQNDATLRHPAYRKLLRQAILWAARKLE